MSAEPAKIVVGIGASAGGLEALKGLFGSLKADTGMAFVVVTHMARGRESVMPEILARHTKMPVVALNRNTALDANTIYVAMPDLLVVVRGSELQLLPRESKLQLMPIDVFLSSLAEQYKDRAIGVILSGSGSDGTLGLKAIKECGGLTLAQGTDGTSPQQGAMPETAAAAGVVDLLISAEKMGPWLASVANQAGRFDEIVEEDSETDKGKGKHSADAGHYDQIYKLLRKRVGHDFSGYKKPTFARRVRRRMQVRQIGELEQYVAELKSGPDEVSALFKDLLIGVTNFFRDPEAFRSLASFVIPKLFADRGVNETVRVWVPGCATGEEVYSLAILLREHADTLDRPPKVQVFATDIDDAALNVARSGRYPAALLDQVSPQRLERFFQGDTVSYSVTKEIRDMCIFSSHSVLRDPPFSRIDMISCRNLLIYLGTEFQAQVVPVFHFALRPRGYLFLGTSENLTQHGDLFSPVEKKHRIFQRRDHATHQPKFPIAASGVRLAKLQSDDESDVSPVVNLRRGVDARVLDRFAPAHVLVNAEGDILHYSPRTGKYLEPAAGLPNRHLLAMARRGLRLELRGALREAVESGRQVLRRQIPVEIDDRVQLVDLTIEPFGESGDDPLFLVLFSDVGPPQLPEERAIRGEGATADQLERELHDARERLQSTIEDYESASEELKSSNEELQSMNEELQSANEEMETSKEELQSVNEELNTVNAELNAKIDEVDRVNADLINVFDSTRIATIFLDSRQVVRSFTPAVTSIFNLISTDRGRPLSDIASHLGTGTDLPRDIQFVLETGTTVERPVEHANGAHFLMRVLPYRLKNNVIDGALITFNDVTGMKEAEQHQRTLVEELNHRVRNMLAVVGAVAKHTAAKTPNPAEFSKAFLGRIDAMAKAYGLVSQQGWNEVSLRGILLSELDGHLRADERRVRIEGPEVKFAPQQAIAIGMIVHELATNSVKYGALSNGKGIVSVQWELEQGDLHFSWSEAGGPKVVKPERKGFGTTLIERQLKSALHAKAKFNYDKAGLQVTAIIPAAQFSIAESSA